MITKYPATPREIARQLCPPVVWNGLKDVSRLLAKSRSRKAASSSGDKQDLDLYWDPKMAAMLETWGEASVWKEIQLLLASHDGKVLDIACGTGRVIEILSSMPVEVHGCDISEFLIGKAMARGIPESRLTVCDATMLPYQDDQFEYAYSIGSLEHFTEEGIAKFLAESHRVTRLASFHNIPVSRSGKDEGWISPYQSYFNNSTGWWLAKFEATGDAVRVIDSTWEDDMSVGKWFISRKRA